MLRRILAAACRLSILFFKFFKFNTVAAMWAAAVNLLLGEAAFKAAIMLADWNLINPILKWECKYRTILKNLLLNT